MPAREDFQYAILRVDPAGRARRVAQRGRRAVLPRRHGFLAARTELDAAALAALSPGCDPAEVRAHLETLARVAAGDPAGGPIAALEPSERFHWLTAPSSTIVQASPVHTGLTADPAAELDRLFATLVQR